jgi:hypothetical protein
VLIGHIELDTNDLQGVGIDNFRWGNKVLNSVGLLDYSDDYNVNDYYHYDSKENEEWSVNTEITNINLSSERANLIDLDALIIDSEHSFHLGSEHIITIDGQAGSILMLSDLLKDGTDLGDWSQVAGTITQGGQVYDVYRHSGVEGELLVQQGVKVELDNH